MIILIVVIAVIVVAVAVTLLCVFLTKDNNKYIPKSEVEIVNSYDNTDELIQKFPVNSPTTVKEGIEKKIQNRLLTGFENWNRGFKAWKKWGDILYTQDSIYNVHGARLTLAHYQDAMDDNLKKVNIQMGDFNSMIIVDKYAAIRYEIKTAGRAGTVMEFVEFKDYGDELGTRVVEGWGGPKDDSYEDMCKFQGDEEKAVQQQQINDMINYIIPNGETDLNIKYKIKYKIEYTNPHDISILNIILEGIDKWNAGISVYKNWLDSAYTSNAINYDSRIQPRTMSKYKEEMEDLTTTYNIEKLYFDHILIRDNWAGIHYRYRMENKQTRVKTVGDRMQFLQFEEISSNLKIILSWVK